MLPRCCAAGISRFRPLPCDADKLRALLLDEFTGAKVVTQGLNPYFALALRYGGSRALLIDLCFTASLKPYPAQLIYEMGSTRG